MPTLAEITGQASAAPSARGQARIPSRRQQAVKDYERSEEMNRRVAEQLFSSPEVLQAVLRQIESSVRGKTLAELAQDPAYLEQLAAGQGQGALVRNLVGDVLAAGQAFLPTYADVLTAGAGKAAALMGAIPMAGSIAAKVAAIADNPLGAFGKLHTAELPEAVVNNMLEWDKPLSKQPESVKQALNEALPDWFHGSPADIYGSESKWFKPSVGEVGEPVVWGTKDWTSAQGYARGEIAFTPDATGKYPITKSYYQDYDGGGGLYSLKSMAKNPLEFDAAGKQWFQIPQGQIIRNAKKAGHDAVIFKNLKDNYQNAGPASDVIAWLDPKAIEKATDISAAELYEQLSSRMGAEQASDFLKNAGIAGIKYQDAGDKATRNFVLFPGGEKYAKIVSRK